MANRHARSHSPPTVQFLGAAQTVTGSMHFVESAGRKLLLDCGLYLGGRPEYRRRNRQFPFDPASIDAVLLSHAHIDHCGNLPNLVHQGFRGPIYCTPATRDLLGVMLVDSARVQERDAHPYYSQIEVAQALRQCVGIPYDQDFAIDDHSKFRFLDAGHLLGSSMIRLDLKYAGRDCRITYTGDLGRNGVPFLRPPADIPPSDLLICESTYGGRFHSSPKEMAQSMANVIERTIGRGGKILIPAFSLGRTQIVVHFLQKWIQEGNVPRVPIIVDSPLVGDIMEVYQNHPECLAEESRSAFAGESPELGLADVHYIDSWSESRELSARREPCVIVASGGMLDGGRAIHHLQHCVDDPRCSIVLVSFQAPKSLGRRLLQRSPTVSFLGRTWNKWADVVEISGFSGHADHADFQTALAPLAGKVQQVCLVHGEPEPAAALATELSRLGYERITVPAPDQVAVLH